MDLGCLRAIINDTALIDLADCRTELDHLRIARAALDTRELEVMRRLDEIADVQPSVFPDDELAKAAKTNLGKSAKVRKRKKACDDIPELADALANGDTTGERVDTFANATAGLKPEELEKVAEHGAAIAAAAAYSTERQYQELLERLVGRARGDDGLNTLARQRRATGFRWWTNQHDGMWQCAGKFDPVRGTELEGRIRNALEALFHGSAGSVPDDCPTDPHERHDHLAALALLALSEGKGTSGLPDVTVLIDEKTLVDGCRHEHSVVRSACSTAPAHCVTCRSNTPRHTTCRGTGSNRASPTSTICCRSATGITTWRTKAAGSSFSNPAARSRSSDQAGTSPRTALPLLAPPETAAATDSGVSRLRTARAASASGCC